MNPPTRVPDEARWRSSSDPYAHLRRLLGSDWTWTPDPVTATLDVRHARGLWFRLAGGVPELAEATARVVATAVLDAVEDGIKGPVDLVSHLDGFGRLLRVDVQRTPTIGVLR